MFAPIASVCVQLLDQACQLRDKASNVLLSEKTKQQRCFRDPFAAASAFPIHGPVDRDHPPPAQGRGCKFHWFLTVARLSQTSLQGPFLGCPPEHLTCPHHGVCYVTPCPTLPVPHPLLPMPYICPSLSCRALDGPKCVRADALWEIGGSIRVFFEEKHHVRIVSWDVYITTTPKCFRKEDPGVAYVGRC